jgi:DNA-binding FrmR family transcriptional regulator
MNLRDPEMKAELLHRLRRIEGQMRGIEAMITAERECREVFQQLMAARSALHSATQAFVANYVTTCLLEEEGVTPERRAELVENLTYLLDKAP